MLQFYEAAVCAQRDDPADWRKTEVENNKIKFETENVTRLKVWLMDTILTNYTQLGPIFMSGK